MEGNQNNQFAGRGGQHESPRLDVFNWEDDEFFTSENQATPGTISTGDEDLDKIFSRETLQPQTREAQRPQVQETKKQKLDASQADKLRKKSTTGSRTSNKRETVEVSKEKGQDWSTRAKKAFFAVVLYTAGLLGAAGLGAWLENKHGYIDDFAANKVAEQQLEKMVDYFEELKKDVTEKTTFTGDTSVDTLAVADAIVADGEITNSEVYATTLVFGENTANQIFQQIPNSPIKTVQDYAQEHGIPQYAQQEGISNMQAWEDLTVAQLAAEYKIETVTTQAEAELGAMFNANATNTETTEYSTETTYGGGVK